MFFFAADRRPTSNGSICVCFLYEVSFSLEFPVAESLSRSISVLFELSRSRAYVLELSRSSSPQHIDILSGQTAAATVAFYVDASRNYELNSAIVPTVVVAVMAYVVVDTFIEIYEMAVWTILTCFVRPPRVPATFSVL